jgi:hypothetical protein
MPERFLLGKYADEAKTGSCQVVCRAGAASAEPGKFLIFRLTQLSNRTSLASG